MSILGGRTLDWLDDAVVMVDQTRLPASFDVIRIETVPELVGAIRRLSVRGAPAIGVAGGDIEAIEIVEDLCGRPMRVEFDDEPRRGDHIWYISDVRKFQQHFPQWSYRYDLPGILDEIHQALQNRRA